MSFTRPTNPVFSAKAKWFGGRLGHQVANQDGMAITTSCFDYYEAEREAKRLNEKHGGKVFNHETMKYE